MSEKQVMTGTIKIDIDQMRHMSGVSIRRASAFVRFGLDGLDERDGGDFNLSAGMSYQFWPKEISLEHRNAAREEFRSWLVGSCLRELDLFHGLLLDKVWFALEVLDLHGTMVRSDYMFDRKFSRKTNVAEKQRLISEKLGNPDHYDELNSLSLGRNALAHHAGHVRAPFDCNNDARDRLTVRWLAFDMLVSRGGEDRVIERLPVDVDALGLPGEGGAQVGVRLSQRTMEVGAGQKLTFTHEQLAELCMFYKIIAEQTVDALVVAMRAKGLIGDAEEGDSTGIEAVGDGVREG